MTAVLLAGALVGLGVLLLVLRYDTGTGTSAAELARLDASRARSVRHDLVEADTTSDVSPRLRRIGATLWSALETRGYRVPPSIRADLSIMGRTVEAHLGLSVLGAVAGMIAPWGAMAPFVLAFNVSPMVPMWLAIFGAIGGFILTTVTLAAAASDRRRAFRHVVSAFLDLVSMNLAGGRGVPEALSSAAQLSHGWAMVRIRDAMETARLQGVTPWAALGALGEEMAVEELRDLAAALALVAEDGAKVRESLSARAVSMRQRELAEAESQAARRSQSMLIAQLLLCVGFLLFLIYPAIAKVVGI